MNERKKCVGCGKEYWETQAWQHEKCGKDASLGPASTSREKEEASKLLVSKSANRRTREAYNAYQREYMRKKREKK